MQITRPAAPPQLTRKVGYGFAIVINLIFLVVAQNLLSWGWPPFLTAEFSEVLPWINLSLALSILVNLIYVVDDRPPLRRVSEVVVSLVSVYVTFQVYLVFPFDFTRYAFDWAIVARVLLLVAMIGAVIGAITNLVKLATASR